MSRKNGIPSFTSDELFRKLDAVLDRTLGDVDVKGVFEKPSRNKGIAGHVIEESVLGYARNSSQEHDIEVDGEGTEVKTTGLRRREGKYVAKEPVSITAVSVRTIIYETFDRSHFWDKARCMLFVYYFYDYNGPFDVQEYRRFLIVGYELRIISDSDRRILEADWTQVHDFVVDAQSHPEPEARYPELSHLQLMFIDIAPKYPHSPRFRFKQAYVNGFIQEHFGRTKQQKLGFEFDRYADFDRRCAQLAEMYRGKTMFELVELFGVNGTINKSLAERIVLKMFDSDARHIGDIDIFRKLGLIGKTMIQNPKGGRTEDMKLFRIDFDEIRDRRLGFEDSEFHSYFNDHQVLTILFKEQAKDRPFGENVFVGFRRISFSDGFIERNIKPVWTEIRRLVNEDRLELVYEYDEKGNKKKNPTGEYVSAPNFPKSKENVVFVRGSGKDSRDKPLELNGHRMYIQYIWIRGEDMIRAVNGDEKF